MKLFYHIRYLFQLLTLVSVFLVLGSLGAWETGGISLWECVLQLAAFTAIGIFCAKAGKKRPAARRRAHAPLPPAQVRTARRVAHAA